MLVVSSSPAAAMAAYPRASSLLLLPLYAAYLCLVSPRATALSFSYNFSTPGDLNHNHADLKYINDSVRSIDRIDLTTKDKINSTGRVFYARPVRLWDGRTGERASFNTSFTFAMIGAPDRPSRGDGMAFFVGPFPASLPPDSRGAFLGLFADPSLHSSDASPPTVAVEFDTYRNTLWDPTEVAGDHMGIDVNSIISSNYTTSLRNADLNGTMSATVVYNAGSKLMVATLQLANGSTHTVQASFDLRDDVGLPQDAAVGFSAATGANVQSNQILSWSFSSTDLASSSKIQVWVIILLSAAASASLAGLVAALLCVITRRRRRQRPVEIPLAEKVPRKFSYRELSTATNNFSKDRELGAGGFGAVYRGELRDPRMPPVAVKRLERPTDPRTRTDYVNEIMILGQLRHHNLVKLVGWCDGGGDNKLLLVYELVPNGSLDVHLHKSPKRLLTWPERYRIVIGIGKAIEYLHTGDKDAILHRDIKPSNVMLDDAFEAKLGDFGLVRQVKPGQSSLRSTVMIGSYDYMDPVCISNNTASTASDMYSFGVLLLEMSTGKEPDALRKEVGLPNALVNAVREAYGKDAVLEMADKRLDGNFDEWQMERVLIVGLLCVQQDRGDRLGIREAVNLLSNPTHPLPQVVSI